MNTQAIKTPVKTLVVSLAMLPILALADGEKVDKTLDTGSAPNVSIENVRGDIKITAWDKKQVRVVGTLDEKAERFDFTADDKEVIIHVKTPKNLRGGDGSKLQIYLPKGGSIEADGVSTDFIVTGMQANLQFDSVSGDVNVDGGNGKLDVETVSGDIDVKNHKGEVELEAVSGDVEYRGSATAIDAEAVSGDVEIINEAELVSGDFETVSGDLDLFSALATSAKLDVESVSGDVKIDTKGTADAEVDVESLSGDIENNMNKEQPRYGKYVGVSLSTKVGKGSGEIEIETVSGNVTLK